MLFALLSALLPLGGRLTSSKHRAARSRNYVLPRVEAVEDRWCPAAQNWQWIGLGGNANWSNSGNWLVNGAPALAGKYPGLVGGDLVSFPGPARAATLDVALPFPLATLQLTGWSSTLTLNKSLWVIGNYNSPFSLVDGSTITLAANTQLTLQDLGQSGYWINGTIDGGASSSFDVIGSILTLTTNSAPGGGDSFTLGTDMVVAANPVTGTGGYVLFQGATSNLKLDGNENYIDVGSGGYLLLQQTITAAASRDQEGGIEFGANKTGDVAIQVEAGGTLVRAGGTAPAGVVNEVTVAGAIYNDGGTVSITSGRLNITGRDSQDRAY
jgi:hypothetical protein